MVVVPIETQVVQSACPENKPYYIEVSTDAWKCADHNEYDDYKNSKTTSTIIGITLLVVSLSLLVLIISKWVS